MKASFLWWLIFSNPLLLARSASRVANSFVKEYGSKLESITNRTGVAVESKKCKAVIGCFSFYREQDRSNAPVSVCIGQNCTKLVIGSAYLELPIETSTTISCRVVGSGWKTTVVLYRNRNRNVDKIWTTCNYTSMLKAKVRCRWNPTFPCDNVSLLIRITETRFKKFCDVWWTSIFKFTLRATINNVFNKNRNKS